ncbi:hypothetical protein OG985_45155 [Streptomyces sp. NBC_00289]|uniref:hypothetical protein n=1 Tax=Streptomyces sp. NBC_00289 TaxID=2975703 RepID=UPI0032474B11
MSAAVLSCVVTGVGDGPEAWDPRDRRGRRYPLLALVRAAACAVAAGGRSYAAIGQRLGRAPQHTLERLGFAPRGALGVRPAACGVDGHRAPRGREAEPGRTRRTAAAGRRAWDLFERYPEVKAGRRRVPGPGQGLSRPGDRPPKKPAKDAAAADDTAAWQAERKAQSSARIPVEHANAEHKQWRPLQRYIGRREYYDQTHLAIAGLVSDRTALR